MSVSDTLGAISSALSGRGKELGDTLVLLESMKMEIPVLTERAGTVRELHVVEGEVLQEGDLIATVVRESIVPVIETGSGNVHVYVHSAADLDKARRVVLNAKTRRTGICGAAECLLIDRAFYGTYGDILIRDLLEAGVEVRAEGELAEVPGTVPARPDDFGREFLDMTIAARLVDGVEGAIAHIRRHGSQHTESILTEDQAAAQRFFNGLDSAILMHNASTQFADGGEFGMGAEIGIATGKMHARGPVGAEQLTSFKYLVRGDGTIRA